MSTNRKLQILLISVVGIAALIFVLTGNSNLAEKNIGKSVQNVRNVNYNNIQLFSGLIKTNSSGSVKGTSTSSGSKVTYVTSKTIENDKSLAEILSEKGITDVGNGINILIDKSDHTLTINYKDTNLKTYHVEFGDGGIGDKEIEGDHKTPEGTFYVANKEVIDPADEYLGSRWLGVSYPAIEDAERGIKSGLIDKQTFEEIVEDVNNSLNPPQETALGGNIGIHGGGGPSAGTDWTWGCIGLKNSDIEDFYDYISIGTPILIQK